MHIRLLIFAFCGCLTGFPLTAQTVELSSRTFWLDDEPRTMNSYPAFFAPQRIGWLDEVINDDPILKDTVIHVEQALMPAAEAVRKVDEDDIDLGPDRLPSQFYLQDYRIVGSQTVTSRNFDYFPVDADAGFKVACGMQDDRQSLLLCVIRATYPPDDGIRLTARLYFPDDPADRPDYFRDVVERMRDLVYCLDVTENPDKIGKVFPKLSGCRPEPVS